MKVHMCKRVAIWKDVSINEVELGNKTGNEMMTLNKVRGGEKDVQI